MSLCWCSLPPLKLLADEVFVRFFSLKVASTLHFCTDSIIDDTLSSPLTNLPYSMNLSDFIIPPIVICTLFQMQPSQITVLSLFCIFLVFCNMMILLWRTLTIKYWMRVEPDVFVWLLLHIKTHVKYLIITVNELFQST